MYHMEDFGEILAHRPNTDPDRLCTDLDRRCCCQLFFTVARDFLYFSVMCCGVLSVGQAVDWVVGNALCLQHRDAPMSACKRQLCTWRLIPSSFQACKTYFLLPFAIQAMVT